MVQFLSLPESDPILHVFLLLAFLLHAIFINLVVGGSLVTVITDTIGMVTIRSHYQQLAATLAYWLPGFLGVAVVLGIFPLVFVQIMYGSLFMPMMNLLNEIWVIAITAGVTGFGGLYGYKHWRGYLINHPAYLLAIGGTNALMFLVIVFIFVVASIFMLDPEKLENIHNVSFWTMMSLSTLFPRFGHLVLASVAGTGIFLTCYGLFLSSSNQVSIGNESEEQYATWVTQYGVAWTLGATLPQVVVGPWLFLSLSGAVRGDLVSGQNFGSIAFFMALTLALLSLVLLNAALMVPHVRGLVIGGIVSLGLTIGLMVIVRHAVRISLLSQYFEIARLDARGYWEVLIIVSTIFLLVLVLTVFMMSRYKKRIVLQ